MKGIKFKPLQAGRKALILGAATVAVAGLSLLGSTAAHAAVGTGLGQLSISPNTGPLTTGNITWSTTTACPTGENFAILQLVAADNTPAAPDLQTISAATQNGTAPITNAGLVAGTTMSSLESLGGFTAGGVMELVVKCSTQAGGVGTSTFNMDTFIQFNTDGTTYTETNTVTGPASTSISVSASPNPVQVGNTVTLTATVTASAGTPVGTVQFGVGGTTPSNIGSPVAVNGSGVATTTTTFTAAGSVALVASFTPTNSNAFSPSTTATPFTETVSATNPNVVPEIITVTVPFQGSFSFGTSDGVAQPTVPLTVNLSSSPLTAAGNIDAVKVVDTRTGTASFSGFPGWSVVGQATDFSNPTSNPVGTIPATQLSWTPAAANGDYVPGGAATGLNTAKVLGSAAEGHGQGTSILGAGLSLTIPATAPAGAYTSTLTLTANPNANTP